MVAVGWKRFYVHEIRGNGEISTMGLFYSRDEAENIVARLRTLPEKSDCRYEMVEAVTESPSTHPPTKRADLGRS